MAQNISEQPPAPSSALPNDTSNLHAHKTDSRDIIQHLKDLDEQTRTKIPERHARIEKGKKRRTYGFGRFACFCLSGGT